MPVITSSLILNKLDNSVKFNFTGVDSDKNSGIYNFKNGAVFIEAVFQAIEGAVGSTDINLTLEELDALENGKEVEYFTNGAATTDAQGAVLDSLYNPTIILKSGDPETPKPYEEDPTAYDPSQPVVTPTDDNNITNPTEAPTESENNNPDYSNDSKSQKNQKISARSFTKTNGCKSFNLNATTSGDGKLTYKSSQKSVASGKALRKNRYYD